MKETYMKVLQILNEDKHFVKIMIQWEVDYVLLTKLLRITVAHNFLLSQFQLKGGAIPPLTK